MVNGIFAPLNLETVLNQGQEEHCTGLIPVKKDTITPYIFQHQSSTQCDMDLSSAAKKNVTCTRSCKCDYN